MKKEKFWYVYAHTNKINGKKYIGITGQQRYWDRWRSDGSGYKTQVFGRAVEKYGWENFEHEILDKVKTESEAGMLEMFYIQKYKTSLKEFGYNISTGGEASSAGTYNLPSMSIPVYQYDLEGNYIAGYPSLMEAERQVGIDNSAICACCKGIHKYTKGFIWSYEKYDKIDGINTKQYRYEKITQKQEKKVYQYNLQGDFLFEYKSVKEASRITGVDFRSISSCCLGKIKSSNGYMWSYIAVDKMKPYENNAGVYNRKSVYQYDICGKLICKHQSVNDTVRNCSVSKSQLRRNCKKNTEGEFSIYENYVWSYRELGYTFFKNKN